MAGPKFDVLTHSNGVLIKSKKQAKKMEFRGPV